MAKTILSFEEYSANLKQYDNATEGNAFGAARAKAIADGEEEFEVDGEKHPVKNVDKEDKENAEEFVSEEGNEEEVEETTEGNEEEVEETAEGNEEEEVSEGSCSEGLTKAYEMACKEAIEYDADDYPDHTLEGYMKENAALVATLAANAMEEGYNESKDEDLTLEMYEAMLNEMKEAYSTKIDEMKEAWNSK